MAFSVPCTKVDLAQVPWVPLIRQYTEATGRTQQNIHRFCEGTEVTSILSVTIVQTAQHMDHQLKIKFKSR